MSSVSFPGRPGGTLLIRLFRCALRGVVLALALTPIFTTAAVAAVPLASGDRVLIAAVSKLLASDGRAQDFFGSSVAISGDTAVVGAEGAYSGQGSVYVFNRSGGIWTQQQKLAPSDGTVSQDFFGRSVAISGDTAVVGSDGDDSQRGSAYVFTRSGGVWTQQQKLTASDGATVDHFGWSVAISGDTVVIGAYFDDSGRGSAYVFTRSGTTWSEQAKLTAPDAATYDYFGYSVAVSGDTAVIGAWGDDDRGSLSGSAYVFIRSGITWSQQRKLTAADGAPADSFGQSVAVSGDTAVIGAHMDGEFLKPELGSTYIFTRSGTTWTQQAKLRASDGAASDQFGCSVGVSGNTVVVGSYQDDAKGFRSGSAYVFTRSGTTWTQAEKLVAPDGASGDRFGLSVAVDGGAAIVGAPWDDVEVGSAHVMDIAQGVGPTTGAATSISIRTSTTSVLRPRPFVLSGVFTLGRVGDPVVVYVKKPGRRYWSYSSKRLCYSAAGDGANWWYRYTPVRSTCPSGTYYFKVAFAGDVERASCVSPNVVVVRVR